MAKKPRKRNTAEDINEDIILKDIEITTKKEWFCNFKINNRFKLNEVHNSFM